MRLRVCVCGWLRVLLRGGIAFTFSGDHRAAAPEAAIQGAFSIVFLKKGVKKNERWIPLVYN
jgi:hypothetical protein